MAEQNGADALEFKPPPGVILPPKEVRKNVELVAVYVARNGTSFESRILNSQEKESAKFQFLTPTNPYNSYYLWRLSEIKDGRGTDVSAGREGEAPPSNKKTGPQPPPEFHFSARMPNMSAVDLDTVRLTALFVAKNGRPWMQSLSQKEMTNPNFAFLRPQHSWHSFFTRLVDQYTELITGDSVDQGRPQKEKEAMLEKNIQDRFHILERARKRSEWVKYQETQKVKKDEQEEAEKLAYAQIDWQDFTVVETLIFDETDDQTQLPPPTSLNDLQSASLEQKAHMSLAPSSHRIEERMPGQEDYLPMPTQTPSYPPTPAQQLPLAMPPPPQQSYMPSPAPSASPASAGPFAPPPSEFNNDEEPSRFADRQAQQQRAENARAAASGQGPMRIRQDYVPRAQAKRQNPTTAICPNCGQAIPMSEMDSHLRIEMLDPRWRDQQRIAQQRSSTTNLSTADVANNLKRLASQRSDLFDPVTGATISKEEEERRKRVEMGSYDGTTTSHQMGVPGSQQFQQQQQQPQQPMTDVQEQIRQLHQKYGPPPGQ